MIAFDTVTRKLQSLLAGPVVTNQSPWIASWQDGEGGPVHTNFVSTNDANPVDVVPAPDTIADGSRRLKFASLSNQDTASITVTVQYVDGGVTHILTVVTLAQGDTLYYEEGSGWYSTDTTGAIKQISDATVASAALSTAQAASSTASRLSTSLSAASISISGNSVSASANSVSTSMNSSAASLEASIRSSGFSILKSSFGIPA
ncbi:MAG TPA: hypothetical protein VF787_03255 [Thermoanaerobaculia bacterium]